MHVSKAKKVNSFRLLNVKSLQQSFTFVNYFRLLFVVTVYVIEEVVLAASSSIFNMCIFAHSPSLDENQSVHSIQFDAQSEMRAMHV